MNIREHIIPVTVKSVFQSSDDIVLYKNYLPPSMLKTAQVAVVLEQNIHESVSIYSDTKDFVICQIRSTIQHEAAHREDEELRHRQNPEERTKFEDFARPGRAEPIAERAEENCIQPESVSGSVEQVDVTSLFEQAKSTANINAAWKSEIVAATLASNVAGEYMAKDMPIDEWSVQAQQVSPNAYKMGNQLFIDVRKIIQPYIVDKERALPANVQTARDGAVTTDPDILNQPGGQQNKGVVPTIPSVPSVPSI